MRSLIRLMLFSVLLVTSFFSLSLGLQKTVYALDHLRTSDEQMRSFITVYDEVLKNYVEIGDASPESLMRGAINGMLQTLDPYSQFFPPADYKKFTEQTQGEFGGLGIRILMARPDAPWLPGWLTVVRPIKGTPSTRCKAVLDGKEYIGLKPDDKIVQIEGKSTRNMTLDEAVDKLKGPPGTSVKIQIARKPLDGPPILLDFEIERELIPVPAIEEEYIKMVDDEVGYIWLTDFTSKAAESLDAAIKSLKGQGMKGLVLDLRDNTGGLLPVAIEICEMFIPKGEVILMVDSRNDRDDETYRNRKDPVTDVPLAVLVNQNSASASEILAGCIQDQKRGIVVGPAPGVNTYGKGSVQTVVKLEDGSGLKLTTALWYTPNRQKIHNQGIIPEAWADMSYEYWIRLRQAEKVAYLKPKMLPTQHEAEKKEGQDEFLSPDELMGKDKVEDQEDLYDKQLFLAMQLLHVKLKGDGVKTGETTAATK